MFIILIIGIFSFHFDHFIINIINNLDDDRQNLLVNFLDTSIYNNEGFIFGIMSDYHRLTIVIVSTVLFFAGFLLLNFINTNKSVDSGIRIALGGSVGNILHRLSCGHVHDYINFFFLNLSNGDVFIIIGVFIIIFFGANNNLYYKINKLKSVKK